MNVVGWGKFYAKTFTGSMYGAGTHVFTLMGYCVANAMPPEGVVEINTRMLAPVFGCKPEEVEAALKYLSEPDPESRTPGSEGRRLIQVGAFTYRLVNFLQYRDGTDNEARKQYFRDKQREYRKTKGKKGRAMPRPSSATVESLAGEHGQEAADRLADRQEEEVQEIRRELNGYAEVPHGTSPGGHVLPDAQAQETSKGQEIPTRFIPEEKVNPSTPVAPEPLRIVRPT
jgi:hypothetical protein